VTTAIQVRPDAPAPSIFDLRPSAMIAVATEVANELRSIISSQKLYVKIQNRDYVKCEGWTTMGAMLGITPRERSVLELEDGSYEAHVDLINLRTGVVVGGASALCGSEERRWGDADRYARRSMAITRATGKAYRLAFSWVMTLAGYEPTPYEEMPHEPAAEQQQQTKTRTVVDESSGAKIIAKAGPKKPPYDGSSEAQAKLMQMLVARKVPEDLWAPIDAAMIGKNSDQLDAIIEAVRRAEAIPAEFSE